jgi:hypothetical protein
MNCFLAAPRGWLPERSASHVFIATRRKRTNAGLEPFYLPREATGGKEKSLGGSAQAFVQCRDDG